MGWVDCKSQYIVCLSLKVDLHLVAGIHTFDYNKNLRSQPGTFPVYIVFKLRPDNAKTKSRAATIVWAKWRVTIADTIKRFLTGRSLTARIVESARVADEATYDKDKDINIDEWQYKNDVEINEINCLLVFF